VFWAAWPACTPGKRPEAPYSSLRVRTGLEVFLEKHLDTVRGKRVGFITNPTGVDGRLRSAVDLLAVRTEFKLAALYAPEHGVRGDAQAGEYVPYTIDRTYNLPVFSLYGQSMKSEPGMLKNIDEYMRSFDTKPAGKVSEGVAVRDIDVMVFDIQDVGTRVYTYIATMAKAMEACAENGVDFIVLDRPDPIDGVDVEGPVLEFPALSSFIGLYPIPERYGMTMGELALLFNDKFLAKKAKLTVVPMEGWKRTAWFDQTGLPWVLPSPNMPTLATAIVYPGQVAFEGTNVSEGRGTTRPFELFGAPWIDGHGLAAKLNGLALPGVAFREAWFTPTFSKYQGQLCGGCQIYVTDRSAYRSFETSLHIIAAIRGLYPNKFEFHKDYFDKVMGTVKVRQALEARTPVRAIVDGLRPELSAFLELRKPYLLY
jgi:uncharacterized protein YbbC (DUF1343 family)